MTELLPGWNIPSRPPAQDDPDFAWLPITATDDATGEDITVEVGISKSAWDRMSARQQSLYIQQELNRHYAGRGGQGPLAQVFAGAANALTEAVDLVNPINAGIDVANNVGDLAGVMLGRDVPDIPEMDLGDMIGLPNRNPVNPGPYDRGTELGASLGIVGGLRGLAARAGSAPNPNRLVRHVQHQYETPGRTVTSALEEISMGQLAYEGGQMAADLGFDPLVGQIGAPMLASGALGVGQLGPQLAFSDPQNAANYGRALEAGVTPTPALVGGESAIAGEGAVAAVPGAGNVIARRQDAQLTQMGDRLSDVMDDVRPPGASALSSQVSLPTGDETILPGVVGQYLTDRAAEAQVRINAALSRLTDVEMDALGGPRAPIPVDRVWSVLTQLHRDGDATTRSMVGQLMNLVRQDRTTVIDRALDAQLQQRRKAILTQISRTDSPAQRDRLRRSLRSVDAQIFQNKAMTVQQLDQFRRRIGEAIGDGTTSRKLDASQQAAVYSGVRSAQRSSAIDQGKLPEFVGAVDDKQLSLGERDRRLGGDAKLIAEVVRRGQDNPARAFDMFFGSRQARQNSPQLMALKRNLTPDEWNTFVADSLLVASRPRTQAQVVARGSSENFNARAFANFWAELPRDSKVLMFSDQTIQALDDLSEMAKRVDQRGVQNRAGGLRQGSLLVGTGAVTFNPEILPQAATALVGTNLLAFGFISDSMVRVIARENPQFVERLAYRGSAETLKTPAREGED